MKITTRLSARETAEAIGVTERTVRRWIRDGSLPALKRGRAFQIDLEAALAVYESRRRLSRPPATLELAELRGRCQELRLRVEELEQKLADAHRHAGLLQAQLREQAA
jgi:excisionase family DNA binding protein